MRIIFAGTPAFSLKPLEAIVNSNFDVVMVVTQPDRKSGRGQKLSASPVKIRANQFGIEVFQPESLSDLDAQKYLFSKNADVMVVVAYGQLLPSPVLAHFKYGCLNIHASLLPRWRGAAPIHRAIMSGDATTGVTIMQMEEGLDTGPILCEQPVAISSVDTLGVLHDKLSIAGSELILRSLEALSEGNLRSRAQPLEGVTYAKKIQKSEAQINWRKSNHDVDRLVRALNPAPGAWTVTGKTKLKIWQTEPTNIKVLGKAPGEIIAVENGMLTVACGEGAINVTVIQKEGSKAVPVAEFLRGASIERGLVFE